MFGTFINRLMYLDTNLYGYHLKVCICQQGIDERKAKKSDFVLKHSAVAERYSEV